MAIDLNNHYTEAYIKEIQTLNGFVSVLHSIKKRVNTPNAKMDKLITDVESQIQTLIGKVSC